MAKKNAAGSGSIRQRPDGRWEARFTVVINGQKTRKSIYADTQNECRKKLSAIVAEVDSGTFRQSCKMSVGEWLDVWANTYLGNVKPRTKQIYDSEIRLHIKPALGKIRLEALGTHTIQQFYNKLSKEGGRLAVRDEKGCIKKRNGKTVYESCPMSAKTIKGIHGVLHEALKQAVLNGLIRFNPADACILPRIEKRELKPFNDEETALFLNAIKSHPFGNLFTVTLFTGMREGEILGLCWDCIDFDKRTITVKRQMQLHQEKGAVGAYTLVSTKNSKPRTIYVASPVIEALRKEKSAQSKARLAAGAAWQNKADLVFTDGIGQHLTKPTVYRAFKKVASEIGRPDARFHDLRHSYATAALRSGIDVKTIQNDLGHASASFTLDIYGFATDDMKKAAAEKMEQFYKSVASN